MARKRKQTEQQGDQKGNAVERYQKLSQKRDIILDRARDAAKYTLPVLYPPGDPGEDAQHKIETPFQGVGARGVSNLAARLLLTLVPPNAPMFRMTLDNMAVVELDAADAQQQAAQQSQQMPGQMLGGGGQPAPPTEAASMRSEIEKALSVYEQVVQTFIESSGDRPALHEAFLHLLVGGNVLLADSLEIDEPLRVFPLYHYACRRDPMGNALEIVIKEQVGVEALPDEFRAKLIKLLNPDSESDKEGEDTSTPSTLAEKPLDLYTHIQRVDGEWRVYQECQTLIIQGTEATYPLGACPYIPLRMYSVAGEDYGRSFVENYLGDLKSLEALSQAIIEASAASAKVIFLVASNGSTKVVDLQKAPNCGFVNGDAKEVTVLQVQKGNDLSVTHKQAEIIERRLSQAFMLLDGVRRDAERVTAEEIRAVAQELEASLGGMYSLMASEFQMAYIKRKIYKLDKLGKLPELSEDMVNPAIVTGFEALGRGNDEQKLIKFISTIAGSIGPEMTLQYINVPDLLTRLAAAIGINDSGLIKSAEQIQQEQQAAQQQMQQQQMMQQAQSAAPPQGQDPSAMMAGLGQAMQGLM